MKEPNVTDVIPQHNNIHDKRRPVIMKSPRERQEKAKAISNPIIKDLVKQIDKLTEELRDKAMTVTYTQEQVDAIIDLTTSERDKAISDLTNQLLEANKITEVQKIKTKKKEKLTDYNITE